MSTSAQPATIFVLARVLSTDHGVGQQHHNLVARKIWLPPVVGRFWKVRVYRMRLQPCDDGVPISRGMSKPGSFYLCLGLMYGTCRDIFGLKLSLVSIFLMLKVGQRLPPLSRGWPRSCNTFSVPSWSTYK
ncbi:hypothetical protein Nepgr_020403 [Nepenthes gracilis]|uniref:Uncharacterized protein n=1 Tax=Nepenthes gracilis TaxID=150966 RepID=A0AAD3SWZ2_NEPGR|nr:hypothetical protein Nepgr_020403 [Nepenthes gracilis]